MKVSNNSFYSSYRLLDDDDYQEFLFDRDADADLRVGVDDTASVDSSDSLRSSGRGPSGPAVVTTMPLLYDSIFFGSYYGSDDNGFGGGGDVAPPTVDDNPGTGNTGNDGTGNDGTGNDGGSYNSGGNTAPPPAPFTLPYDVIEFLDDAILKVPEVVFWDGTVAEEVFLGSDQGSGDGDNNDFIDFANSVIDAQALAIFTANSNAADALSRAGVPFTIEPNGSVKVEGYGFAVYAPGSSATVETTTVTNELGSITYLKPPGSALPSGNVIGAPGANPVYEGTEMVVTGTRTPSAGPLASISYINAPDNQGGSSPIIGTVTATDPALDDIGIVVTAKKPGAGLLMVALTAAWQDFWGKLTATTGFSNLIKDVVADGRIDADEYRDLYAQISTEINADATLELGKSASQLMGLYVGNDDYANSLSVQLSYFYTT